MKIRTQLILGAALFGIVLLVIAASVVTTTAELGRLDRQVQVADRIGVAASDLSFLSNEYLLYGEPQQIQRWEARYASLGDDLSNLTARTPDQEALVTAITEDRLRLRSVFDEVAAGREGRRWDPADPAEMQVSWSRIGVQTQGLAYDASRLSALLGDEANGLQSVNTLLVAVLLGAFAAVLLTNYFVVGRRTVRSISTVLAGTEVIGTGDLGHAIPVAGNDEVAELSRAFNRMTADLRTVTASRAELEEKEAELQSVALFPAQNPVPVLRVDEGGRLLYINPAGTAAFGNWDLRVGASLPESLSGDVRVAKETGTPHQAERRFGATTYSIAVVPIQDRRYVNLYFADITERKRAEESLLTYAHAIDTTYDAIFTAGPDMVIQTWNEGAERLFGYPAAEAVASTTDFLETWYPPDRPREEMLRQLTREGFWTGEVTSRRKDGTEVTTLASATLVRDDRGAPIGYTAVHHDISERRRAEGALKEYAEDLKRSNEDLERFAYVSSHDLQEPLRSIVSFSQLLERRYKGQLDADADEFIEFIVEGGVRMQSLIQDLLAYSRVNTTKQELTPTDTAAVLASVDRSLAVPLCEAGGVITHDAMPMVLADPIQLEQVFANLVSNAIKFRRPDEPLRIHVGARKTDGFWEFSVADNGIGIEKEYFDRIFVIFQRLHTKDVYPGTGIGLAIVKRIIDRHGGRVWVESVPGEGTTFFFTLPAA